MLGAPAPASSARTEDKRNKRCRVISGHRPPQTLSVGTGVTRDITAREPAARPMPRSQTLSPVSDAISCGVSGRGKHGGVTALTGAGERGHCHNTAGPHGVYVCGSSCKAHRCGEVWGWAWCPWAGRKNVDKFNENVCTMQLSLSLRRKQLSILRAQDHEIIVQTAVGWTVHQVYCTTGPRRVNPILAGANSIKTGGLRPGAL